jgi:hypothetical protein
MISREYGSFVEACNQRGIALHYSLQNAHPNPEGANCFTPSPWFSAIAVAGELLRSDPHPLASNIPPASVLGNRPTIEEQALYTIVHDSVVPQPLASSGYNFKSHTGNSVANCKATEKYFAETFTAMQHPHGQHMAFDGSPLAWITIHDGRTPIAIQKQAGAASTLSLVPLQIDGIRYPAGSLFDIMTSSQKGWPITRNGIAWADSIIDANFLRLTRYALPPPRRPDVFGHSRIEATQWPITLIRHIARTAAEVVLQEYATAGKPLLGKYI